MKTLLFLLFLLLVTSAVFGNDLYVLTPKTVRGILMEVSNFYEKNNPGWEVQLRTGGSQELSNLIVRGTPADIFLLSEDKAVQDLKEKQITTDAKPFLADDVVVVAPLASKLQIDNPSKLTFPELKGVALFEEDDPLGKSSREFLKKIGVLDSIQSKIGIQENAKAVRKSLEDGITDWGILFQSDADAPTIKVIYRIPEKDITPHYYYLGSIANSPKKDAIQKFMATIRSTIIGKFFENAGFRVVK